MPEHEQLGILRQVTTEQQDGQAGAQHVSE